RDAIAECRSQWLQLMEIEFLDDGYWAAKEHRPGFKERYRSAKFKALQRLSEKDYKDLLHMIFSRVVVLRNQIMHGCATFGRTSLGWKSVETTNPVLRVLIPAFHLLMTQYPESIVCPPIPYPRLGSAQHPKRSLGI